MGPDTKLVFLKYFINKIRADNHIKECLDSNLGYVKKPLSIKIEN